MKARRILTGILTVVALSLPMQTLAFSIQNPYFDYSFKYVSRWPVSDLTYYIDSRAVDGSGITATESQNIMKATFKAWQDIDCSALTFTMLGNSSSQDVLPITMKENGKNELVWVSGSTECQKWQFGESALGVTLPMQDYSTGQITEADIAFNNCNYRGKWVEDASRMSDWDDISFTGVSVHEIGHFFGQQHSWLEDAERGSWDDPNQPTMAPYISPYGYSDSLEDDDKRGACFLYPDPDYYAGNKGFYKCTRDSECPRMVSRDDNGNEVYDYKNFTGGRLKCSGGYCMGVYGSSPGASLLGVFCTSGIQCNGGYCMDLGDGYDRCTKVCNVGNDTCASGYHCEDTGNGQFCMQGQVSGTIGARCTLNSDCDSKLCFTALDETRTCRKKCYTDSGCASDEYCWLKGSYGGCFKKPVQDLKVGDACTGNDQCESGLCKAGTDMAFKCRQACEAAGTCPDGFFCNVIIGACMPGDEIIPPTDPKEEGAECLSDDECRSGLCFAVNAADTHYCRVECDLADWFCPTEGTACVGYDVVDSGVCMPVDDRGVTGDECTARTDCVSGICLGTSRDEPLYCSQECVEDWCPEGFSCRDAGSLGRVCVKSGGTEPGEEDETGGGCSAGSLGTGGAGTGAAGLLLLLVGWFVFATAIRHPRNRAVRT